MRTMKQIDDESSYRRIGCVYTRTRDLVENVCSRREYNNEGKTKHHSINVYLLYE